MWKRVAEVVRSGYADEERRKTVMFQLLNVLLAVVAGVMTVVNLATAEYELMIITGVFALLCLANVLCIKVGWPKQWKVVMAFTIEAQVLLVYFVLGGIPEGFSVLWTLLVPAVSLYALGRKVGVRFSILTFLMVTFFFWTPLGKSWLYYDYSPVFMLRFPFVYICMFLMALYIDIIRLGVYHKLKETEEQARYLYRHDALTGIYNRYAFSEELKQLFESPAENSTSVVMFDIDDFKDFNDRYGHNAGDELLKTVARIIQDHICEHCVACRWGGEEFLVLMQCQHDPYQMAETIRKNTAAVEIPYEGQTLKITLSAGVAVTGSLVASQLSPFINCADKAMYASKESGKNRTTLVQFKPKG